MSLKENILKELKEAVKKQQSFRLKAIRFLQAAIKNKEIELRPAPIKEEEVLGVVKKQIKQIQESIEYYKKASGYEDTIKEEESNIAILKEFLPQALSEEALTKIIESTVEEVKPQSIKDMGKIMKAVLDKTKGAADNKLLSQLIKNRLQNL